MYTEFVKNVTISLPESVLEKLRKKAKESNQSLNAWLREVLTQEVEGDNWAEEYLKLSESTSTTREPWMWNREELYEERLGGHEARVH